MKSIPSQLITSKSEFITIQNITIQNIFDCRKQNEVMMNVEGGYLLRSKSASSNEVGLMSGSGALDLPTLVS